MKTKVTVVGAGLAGCEAAFLLASAGVPVTLIEQKPSVLSPAHKSENFAELVCSNSLKAERRDSAAGLLKLEMRAMGSLCLRAADCSRVAAGGALAVNRDEFSAFVTRKIQSHPLIEVVNREQDRLPEGNAIIATGPLTQGGLYAELERLTGGTLSFFDAAAPIVTAESVDFSRAFFASRYGRGGEDDYINCPFNKEEYERFWNALVTAETASLHEFDVYEGCMPIEVLAKRGMDTVRFGPMKPVGLKDPATGHRPWAAVQLRRENSAGTLYNLVGFQTNLKFGEQTRVFSMIPGLGKLEIVRYGVMHRNSFLDSPRALNPDLSLKVFDTGENPSPRALNPDLSLKASGEIYVAGQLTGVEGYMESAACGLVAAMSLLKGKQFTPPPPDTMTGALMGYITDESVKRFQPMGANFGILPPLAEQIRDKRERYDALAVRALASMDDWLTSF